AGLAVAASDGTARCVVPNGTAIPAGGHFLCANSVAYSISGYPAGNGTTATANTTYTEGTGYPALTASNIDYSFFRKYSFTTGLPTDTGNNATDFVFADTQG